MKKAHLLSGICLLGLTACVNTNSDTPMDNEFTTLTETTTTEITTEILPPCESDDTDCVMTDNFLTDDFALTQADGTVALSRPASKAGISVKEKQKEALEAQAAADQATKSTGDVKTADTDKLPVVVLTKEVKTEETQVAKEAAPSATSTEQANNAKKADEEIIKIEDKSASKSTTDTDTSATDDKTGTKETTSENETISMSERLVPLKKVKTTITETTTRIQDNPETTTKEVRELLDKIHYGEEVHDWEALSGTTIRTLLTTWAAKSGWTVVWKIDRDYHLEAGVVFRGTFTDVSGALIRSFARATPAPIGTFYQGNRVLLITTQEDENAR